MRGPPFFYANCDAIQLSSKKFLMFYIFTLFQRVDVHQLNCVKSG